VLTGSILLSFRDMTTGRTTEHGRTTDGPTLASIAYLALEAGQL